MRRAIASARHLAEDLEDVAEQRRARPRSCAHVEGVESSRSKTQQPLNANFRMAVARRRPLVGQRRHAVRRAATGARRLARGGGQPRAAAAQRSSPTAARPGAGGGRGRDQRPRAREQQEMEGRRGRRSRWTSTACGTTRGARRGQRLREDARHARGSSAARRRVRALPRRRRLPRDDRRAARRTAASLRAAPSRRAGAPRCRRSSRRRRRRDGAARRRGPLARRRRGEDTAAARRRARAAGAPRTGAWSPRAAPRPGMRRPPRRARRVARPSLILSVRVSLKHSKDMRPPPTVCRRARVTGAREICASTAWISAYWDGARPSEASIDESAARFCTRDIERKKTEPVRASPSPARRSGAPVVVLEDVVDLVGDQVGEVQKSFVARRSRTAWYRNLSAEPRAPSPAPRTRRATWCR